MVERRPEEPSVSGSIPLGTTMQYINHLKCKCCKQSFHPEDCLICKSNPDRQGFRWFSWQCPKCNSILRLEIKK